MKKIKEFLLMLLGFFVPVKKNTVFFDSFSGQYNDNPKYISEALHKMDPNVEIVWSYSSHGKETAPEYCKKVLYKSLKYYWYLGRASVVVDNYTGLRSFGFFEKKNIISYFVRKKKQLCISTWHGTPLKKIGADILNKKCNYYYTCTDFCVAGCKYTADIEKRVYLFENRIKLIGTPRNDILLSDDVNTCELKRKLRLPENKKIVLFAPTFRENIEMSGIIQFKMFDIPVILTELSNKFHGEFIFVFRVHQAVIEKINNENLIDGYENLVFDGNLGDDMAEYLACTDVLITDYSGSLFDYALTGKPCFLFAPDREHYENVERGLYINYDSLPFPISYNGDMLIQSIKNFPSTEYKQKLNAFLEKIGNEESGNASETIASDITNFLNTGNKSELMQQS